MAHKLGYTNFVELGYRRMKRTDYDAEMVANFRKQIKQYIVPLVVKLKDRQRLRLGLENLSYYDDKCLFSGGNAAPGGDEAWIVEQGKVMFTQMSPQTNRFFDFMCENHLMDLSSKPGKVGGAYSKYFSKYKSPFIFANFNGTAADIQDFIHEAGHAFEKYLIENYQIPEYNYAPTELMEVHAMSMEYFSWPWLKLFFGQGAEKYQFSKLIEMMAYLPYFALVDEFQHWVYQNPQNSIAERKALWRKLEKEYLPYLDYRDNQYLEEGNYWHQQEHIFELPFYYIDYALAEICASRLQTNWESAWQNYLKLCQLGGSVSFTEGIMMANLISPFDDGCIQSIIGEIEHWLEQVDDSKF